MEKIIEKKYEFLFVEYFLFAVIFQNTNIDFKSLFSFWAKQLYIPKKEVEHLYEITLDEDIASITGIDTYNRSMRILQYLKETDKTIALDKDVLNVLKYKGLAIKELFNAKLITREDFTTIGHTLENLENIAKEGNILALHILGISLIEGFIVRKNETLGIQKLNKCVLCNHTLSIIYMINNFKNKEIHMDKLHTIYHNSISYDNFEEFFKGYTPKKDLEAELYEIYSKGNPEIKNKYKSSITRIICSENISFEEKKRILKTKSEDYIEKIAALATKSRLDTKIDFSSIEVPMNRKADFEKIEYALKNKKDKPLFIQCNDWYLEKKYVEIFQKLYSKENIVEINCKNLKEKELTNSNENFMISELLLRKKNDLVFIFKNVDELNSDFVLPFLQNMNPKELKNFRLANPLVSLDLSHNSFVLFSAKEIDERILSKCEIVKINELSKEEKKEYIQNAVSLFKDENNIEIEMPNAKALEYLFTFNSFQIHQILDNIFYKINKDNKFKITYENISKVGNQIKRPFHIGFELSGGMKNENA